jgi:multidrug efflux pump subunit AcrA (membrane-fusion protein)
MTTQVDLQQLRVERAAAGIRRAGRSVLSRYVVPGGIVIGFAVLFAIAVKDRWITRRTVRALPVAVVRADVRRAAAPLFQAPGWVEPRPTPILVSAQTTGVIEELCVVEGQEVAKGEPLARLQQIDGQLAVQQAQAELRLRAADVVSAETAKVAAEKRFQNPLHLKIALAEAQSQLAKVERDLTSLPNLVAAAQSRLDFARTNAERKRQAANVIAGRLVEQAESDLRAAEAELKELEGRGPGLRQEIGRLGEQAESLGQQLTLLAKRSAGWGNKPKVSANS